MTDLSEESVLGADRYALTVWSRLSACLKKLSSSRPEGQERLGGAEAAGLSGRFRSTRLHGRWWGNGRPRAPQTEPAIERPTAHAVCLVALRAKSVALCSSLSQISPFL